MPGAPPRESPFGARSPRVFTLSLPCAHGVFEVLLARIAPKSVVTTDMDKVALRRNSVRSEKARAATASRSRAVEHKGG